MSRIFSRSRPLDSTILVLGLGLGLGLRLVVLLGLPRPLRLRSPILGAHPTGLRSLDAGVVR